ncbi:MAG: MgtC/SapB family protein [Bacteroidales bacterium]|nr:MgtC/SapB family protein [Bacteroidales bacterium]
MEWTFVIRLLIAGILGGVVGLERELRAKEAGVRTHFLVALGSALFMLISQFAFGDQTHDAARVAAQVVSGIGFIGAGVIIFQKNAVRGITTAAGLWVVAAIGLSCGGGMYIVASAAAVFTVVCLEAMHFVHLNRAEKTILLSADCPGSAQLKEVLNLLKESGITPESYALQNGRATLTLHLTQKSYLETLPAIVSRLTNPAVENA